MQIESNLEAGDLIYENGEGHDSEGDEDFHESETTKENDMQDKFSKLMKVFSYLFLFHSFWKVSISEILSFNDFKI